MNRVGSPPALRGGTRGTGARLVGRVGESVRVSEFVCGPQEAEERNARRAPHTHTPVAHARRIPLAAHATATAHAHPNRPPQAATSTVQARLIPVLFQDSHARVPCA